MIRLRYRLSWLLLVPVVLAAVVWWFKPPAHPPYDYLTERFDSDSSIYWIKPSYMQNLLVLWELRDCDYAVLAIGAEWSPEDVMQFRALSEISDSYKGRVPFLGYDLAKEVWPYSNLSLSNSLPNYKPGMKAQGFVGIVQRGKIIAMLSGPGECLTPAEYRQKIDDCLPWNYKL